MSTMNPYVPPSGGASPPATPTVTVQPGSSLDFGRALGFFFKDPNWVQKLLVGSLFSLLSMFLVGGIFIAGYAARLVRRAARGEEYPLPEWDDLGGMFSEGLAIVGAYLAHLLPAIVAVFILVIPMAALGDRGGEPPPAAMLVLFPLVLAASLLIFAVLLYFPAAFIRLALEERFSSAFEVEKNWAFIRRNGFNYMLAIVAFLAANFIAQFGIILFCVGIIPATFWSQCVGAYAFGEVALRDPARVSSGMSAPPPPR